MLRHAWNSTFLSRCSLQNPNTPPKHQFWRSGTPKFDQHIDLSQVGFFLLLMDRCLLSLLYLVMRFLFPSLLATGQTTGTSEIIGRFRRSAELAHAVIPTVGSEKMGKNPALLRPEFDQKLLPTSKKPSKTVVPGIHVGTCGGEGSRILGTQAWGPQPLCDFV